MSRTVGIDLGAEALRGVVLENVKGSLELITAGSLPLGELGLMEDNEDKRLAIGEKLKELVRGARLKAPQRRIGLSNNDAELRYLMVPPVPPWRLEMLAKYEVEERSESTEAKTFDYRILDIPDASGQYMVLIGCCPETASEWLLETGRKARLGEVEVDLKPLALYNAYYHGHGYDTGQTVLIVDIGAEHAMVLLVKDGALYLARTLMGGGRRFTQVLADDMRMTPLEADEIKKREAEIRFDLPQGGTARGGTRTFRGRTGMFRRPTTIAGAAARDPAATGLNEPTAVIKRPDEDSLRLKDEVRPGTPGDQRTEAKPAGEAAKTDAAKLKDDLATREAGETTAEQAQQATEPTRAQPSGTTQSDGAPATESAETPQEKRKRQMSMSLVREAAALCAAMENVVSYCRQQNKLRDLKVEKVYITGAGSRLKGLETFIGRRMRMPVERLEVFRNISMDRLPADAAEGLKAEQDTMAVSVGLALAGLCKGAFSFLLWPAALKEKKEFRARGAFLHYAAALLLAVIGLAWITPKHNIEVFADNYGKAEGAVTEALKENAELDRLIKEHEELFLRLEQIEKNAGSGHSLLNIMAELKDPKRIPNNIYLTQFSTTMPHVILTETGDAGEEVTEAEAAALAAAGESSDAPDTFTAQAKVYLRGFARGQKKTRLLDLIIGDPEKGVLFKPGFCDLLLPHPNSPEHAQNVFKDLRPIWFDNDPNNLGVFALQEFVLEGFLEGTREEPKKTEREKDPSTKQKAQPEKKAAPSEPLGAKAAQPTTTAPAAKPATRARKTEAKPFSRPTMPPAKPKAKPQPKPAAKAPVKPVRPAPKAKPAPKPKEGEFVLPGNMPE